MKSVRLKLSKMGIAKYISHLDFSRAMQRALKRAALPVWYTEGFNPHLYVNFLLPLSLGTESLCEFVDIRLIEDVDLDEVQAKLNSKLPRGIKILSCVLPKYKHTEIDMAQYEITVRCKQAKQLTDFILADKLEVTKQTKKRGAMTLDIASAMQLLDTKSSNDEVFIKLNLPAGVHESINPMLIFDAFSERMNVTINSISILRTRIFCANGEDFS